MAYIGRGTDNISNVEVLDNITFNGNSSYTLQKSGANFVPVSANNILVSIDGIVQANNFSVSGSTIDFGVAVANTSTCNFVLHFGTGLITTVQDGAITTVKIGDDAVTYAKLQNLATANRVLGSTSTGLIGETQIATAMVSDDAITYAKMQDTSTANRVLGAASAGTIGEVQVATDMIADAQVDESKLKISNAPTNGYVLTAQSGNTGGLTWASMSSDYVRIAQTVVTSSTASVTFQNGSGGVVIDSTYKNYIVAIQNCQPVTQGDTPRVRVGVAGTIRTSGYFVEAFRSYYSGGTSRGSRTDSIFSPVGGVEHSVHGEALCEIVLNNLPDANFKSAAIGMYALMDGDASATNQVNQGTSGGIYGTAEANDTINIYFGAGNILKGTFTLYGRK